MEPPTRIHLVRHGRVDNPSGILYGRLPGFGLSGAGREEARRVARLLAGVPVAAVFSSPLLRARQTAREILRAHPGLRLRTSRLLDEVLTPFQGRPLEEARAAGEDFYTGAGPGFEQPGDVARRMERFVRRVCRELPGRDVVAVTHGDPIAFLLLRLHGRDPDPRRKASLHGLGIDDGYPATGSVTTLELRPGSPPTVRYTRPGG